MLFAGCRQASVRPVTTIRLLASDGCLPDLAGSIFSGNGALDKSGAADRADRLDEAAPDEAAGSSSRRESIGKWEYSWRRRPESNR